MLQEQQKGAKDVDEKSQDKHKSETDEDTKDTMDEESQSEHPESKVNFKYVNNSLVEIFF